MTVHRRFRSQEIRKMLKLRRPSASLAVASAAASFDDGTPHVATAWTSGQDIGDNSCIFIGQALATN
jgi:hypothetical protein